jgi:hypothetical protein
MKLSLTSTHGTGSVLFVLLKPIFKYKEKQAFPLETSENKDGFFFFHARSWRFCPHFRIGFYGPQDRIFKEDLGRF